MQQEAVAEPAHEQPKERRGLKKLAKIEIGRRKKADDVEPAAVMAAPAHAAEPLPPEDLPEILRPEPEPEFHSLDPFNERLDHQPVPEADADPEPVAPPEPEPSPEPVVELDPDPVVEIESDPEAEPEPTVDAELRAGRRVPIDPEPAAGDRAFRRDRARADGLRAADEPSPAPNRISDRCRAPSWRSKGDELVARRAASRGSEASRAVYDPEPSLYSTPTPWSRSRTRVHTRTSTPSPAPSASRIRASMHRRRRSPSPSPRRSPSPRSPSRASTGTHRSPESAEQPPTDAAGGRYPETEVPGSPPPIVKPIETVSAMDLLMQDVEERQTRSDDSDG